MARTCKHAMIFSDLFAYAMVNNTRHEETWIQRLRLVQNVTESGATKVISSQPSGTDLL